MYIALCDDNQLFLREMRTLLAQISAVENVAAFSSLSLFFESIRDGAEYDAVLMDIDWKSGTTGIDVAQELYEMAPRTKIIYVTGYTDRFVQQIFLRPANLSGFLTKPVDKGLLEANLAKLLEEKEETGRELVIQVNGAAITLPLAEILYIESSGHTVTICTKKEEIRTYEKLKDLLAKLPEEFYQCHKSFIINMRQIRRLQYDVAILKNGSSVPVSRSRHAGTKEAYFALMGREL